MNLRNFENTVYNKARENLIANAYKDYIELENGIAYWREHIHCQLN